MRTGSSPPAGFSVYLTRRNLYGEAADAALKQHIILPRVIVGGADLGFMSRSFGFTGVNVIIVWHPGWPITHAQVDDGRAVRLWPDPYELEFGGLPEVHPKELAFRDESMGPTVLSTEGFARVALRPLSVDSDPYAALFGNAT